MPNQPDSEAVIDNNARLTLDLVAADENELARLRGLLNAAGSTSVLSDASGPGSLLNKIEVSEPQRKLIAKSRLARADARKPAPILVVRRDLREELVAGSIAGPLTALGGSERLGPFLVGDRPVFFDFWREARRVEVIEQLSS